MAGKKTVKQKTAPSVQEEAKETMRKLGVKKAYVSEDGYVFLNEADVRAYVGKNGSYKAVADEVEIQEENPAEEQKAEDKVLDKHIDETDGN